MKRLTESMLICIALILPATAVPAPNHGEVNERSGQQRAWDADASEWVSLSDFWSRYADTRGGYTWGHSADYPEYDKVKEFDTFLVKTAKGDCLMEFFHSRWRRANDVQRWDDAFNEYAGCPYVFD